MKLGAQFVKNFNIFFLFDVFGLTEVS